MDDLERHREALTSYLGVEAPETLIYRKFEHEVDRGPCPAEHSCSRDRKIFSNEPLHRHELIHGYLDGLNESELLPAEGVASAFECTPWQSWQWPRAEVDWRDVADSTSISYDAAQVFVAHLLREHGPDRFLDWYESTGYPASSETLEETFEETFGASIDDEYELAQQGPPCNYAYECATAPPLPLDGELFSADFSCYGAMEGFSLEITEESLLTWESIPGLGTGYSSLSLLGCTSRDTNQTTATPHPIVTVRFQNRGEYFLSPGKYVLMPTAPSEGYRAWLTPAPLPNERCEEAPESQFRSETDSLLYAIPGTDAPQYIKVKSPPGVTEPPRFASTGFAEGSLVQVCKDCSESECEIVHENETAFRGVPLPEWEEWVVRIEGFPKSRGFAFGIRY